MNLREFIQKLEEEEKLIKIKKEISVDLEVAKKISEHDGKPILFENVKNYDNKVVAGVLSTRDLIAESLGIKKEDILKTMVKALDNLKEPEIIENAPCQENIIKDVDLSSLPILKYLPKDGGRYIPSAVAIIKDPETGRNMCFHRWMELNNQEFSGRIVEGRGTDSALNKNPNLEIAICIGNATQVMLAAATSIAKDQDELSYANALSETKLVKCKTIDVEVPAETEIVLECKFTGNKGDEGPFLDLTETYDFVRQQPTVKVQCITHRNNYIYQALLPGKLEHKNLMGMPREPTIFKAINGKSIECKNVIVTPGGCSWLHAVAQIKKENPDDGKKAIEGCFEGHKSLKHCVIVDKDINIFDIEDIERAIATRFQADKDLLILTEQKGSSLDPSGDFTEAKAKTTKMGIDATIPSDKPKEKFKKVNY